MTKRILSFLMALMLLCGIASIAAAEEPATLTIATTRRTTDITESYNQKNWAQEIEKACNVKINWIELTEGQIEEPLTALLAASPLPDIFWSGKAMSDSIVSLNTKLWHVITEDEIKTYMPNLYNFYENYFPTWRENQTYPDGNIYSLPAGALHSRMHTTYGIQYINTKWLERVGKEIPTTMEEFHDVLVAFRDMDANGNGDATDEIPFDFCDKVYTSWLMNAAVAWGLPIYPNGKVYYSWDKDGNVIGAVNTPAYREFIEYYHQLGQEGLINLEGFAQTQDQFNANLNADKVGVFWAWGPCNHITDKELFLQFEAFVPPAAEGYETVLPTRNMNFMNAYRNGFMISKDCKNIEKAYEIWEYASDPIKALEINNGSRRGLLWEFVDENNEYLPADATIEDIAAHGFKYLMKEFDKDCPEGCTHEKDAALIEAGYEWCIGKTYTGGNTLGLVDIAPLMIERENYRTTDLSVWGVQRYVSLDKYDPTFCPFSMNSSIVPAEAQEEFDFSTDGLYNIINGFFSDAIMKGVTDESWNSYLADLENYGYNYYVDFYNKLAHNEL